MSASTTPQTVDPAGGNGWLFVSFWHLELDNLPSGSFDNLTILASEAAALISSARERQRFMGVSRPDLLAPYEERACRNHTLLCESLLEKGIVLSFDDFLGGRCINPLSFARLSGDNSLLVINCGFSHVFGSAGEDVAPLEPETPAINPLKRRLRWAIAPDSITFHLLCHIG
jgi:hypothetical protein